MEEYHKIQTVFKRDPQTNHRTLLEGEYSMPEFEYLKDNEWVFTEKVDGMNVRVLWTGEVVEFGGRTDKAQMPTSLFNALTDLFSAQTHKFVEMFGDWNTEPAGEMAYVCLYGEGYGAKIQKGGGNYRQDQGFVLFDVNVGGWWLRREDVQDVADKLGIDTVPIIGTGTLEDLVFRARIGFLSDWGDFPAEGIVARPKTELKTRSGHRIITKIKCKDFIKEK